jgi:hypothetical protein
MLLTKARWKATKSTRTGDRKESSHEPTQANHPPRV